jgi:hypothetical protein
MLMGLIRIADQPHYVTSKNYQLLFQTTGLAVGQISSLYSWNGEDHG